MITGIEFCVETKLSDKSMKHADLVKQRRSTSSLQGSLMPAQLAWFDPDGCMVGILEFTLSHVDPLEP